MRLMNQATGLLFALVTTIGFSAHASEPEAVPGEFIVKMKTQVSDDKSALNVLSERLGSQVLSVIPSMNIVVIKRPVIELESSIKEIVGQDDGVDYIEPNFIYRANRTPNDPMLGQLWGMNNSTTAGIDIGAPQAWEIETGNQDLIVAVIDTGINYNHPDLVGNIWTNEAEANGQPGVDDDGNGVIDDIHGYNAITQGGNPLDDHGHGSHCSGTIGAKGDDGKGIVGVAWNVKLMGVKFLSASGSGSLDGALRAIDYATKMGAKVMSNSWGGGGFSQALKEAIERSNTAGALFVAAAGNNGSNNDASATYPASYPVANVLAVAAIDSAGQLASFSNYGKSMVHVGAPGVNVTSSNANGGYDTWSGTSMATPHVSGIAALVASHEPNLTNLELKARIIATSKPIAGLRGKVRSGGLANAYLALTNTLPPLDPNDPANWQTVPVSVSNAKHPYDNDSKETFEVNVPGAKEISLYFARFETEARYDVLTIKDAAGNVIATMSGVQSDSFSVAIPGETAKLEFTTDRSMQKYGFDITKAAYR